VSMLPKTISELDRIKKECRSMVNKKPTASAAAAAIPLPGLDVGADVAIMLELLPAINRRFGLSREHLDSTMKGRI